MPIEFYEDPVAYDVIHTPGTAAEVDGLARMAARFVGSDGGKRRRSRPEPGSTKQGMVWLEPACGSGRYVRVAAGRGIRIVGFDLSEAMVAYARDSLARRGLDELGSVHVADMTDFARIVRGGSVGFAFNMINTIRHLPSDTAMIAHLEQVRRALRRGGVYAVGLDVGEPGQESASEDVWTGQRGLLRVTQIAQYEPPLPPQPPRVGSRSERVVNHIVVKTPSGEQHFDSAYTLRTYTTKQWTRLIERSGFELVGTVDEMGDPYEMGAVGYGIWVLRKAMGSGQ